MRDININFNDSDISLYKEVLIRQGEHLASQLICTIPEDMLGYQYILVFKINNETPIFTVEQTPINGVITYVITNILTAKPGDLKIELHAYENLSLTNQRLVKSARSKLQVTPSLATTGIIPEDYIPWYTQVANMYDEVVDIEEHIDDVYENIVTDELSRQEAEFIRVSSENARIGAEALRNGAEIIRLANEGDAFSGRVKAEADRVDAEAARVIAEGDATSGRVKAEIDRVDAEALRVIAEGDVDSGRVKAEADRETAEGLRDAAETDREDAETARAVFEVYDAETAYVVGNKVTSAGSAYVCIQNGTNKDPATETAYWLLISSGGTGTSVITGMTEAETYSAIADTDTINTAFGKVKKFFTDIAATIRATVLTGLSVETATDVEATDTLLVGVGKLQGQTNAIDTKIGTQTYTEQNYVTDGASDTENIDALDMAVKDVSDVADAAIPTASIVNDLTTGGTAVPLSAEQGKTLQGEVGTLDSLSTTEKGSLVGAINENTILIDTISQFTDTDSKVYSWVLTKSATGVMQIEYTEVV